MNKTEMVLKLKQKLDLPADIVKRSVDIFFNIITTGLADGKRIDLREFGSFSLRQHSAKLAYNPQTGRKFYVAPKQVPFFKASKSLKDKLNDDYR